MKTAVVLLDGGVRQIMLYAENDAERMAIEALLKTKDEEMGVEFKSGSFYGGGVPDSARGYVVQENQAGYYRAFEAREDKGLMIVIRPKSST